MPRNNITAIHYENLNSHKELNLENADNDKYRKIGSARGLFEESNRDYYKPKVIDRGFAGEVNNYIKYISEGDKDEKLSPREYLNMIRPDLRDLINRHKPIERLNNNTTNNNTNSNDTDNTKNTDNNNNNNNNNNNKYDNDNNSTNNTNNNNNNTYRGEWEFMLRIYIKCIFSKSFNETRTMHPKSRQVEVYRVVILKM